MELVKRLCWVPRMRWSAGGVGGFLVAELRIGEGAEQEQWRRWIDDGHRTSLYAVLTGRLGRIKVRNALWGSIEAQTRAFTGPRVGMESSQRA